VESAFAAFGGVPAQILIDNPRALVTRHDSASRIVQFNEKFLAFAKHWGFPRAPARPSGAHERQECGFHRIGAVISRDRGRLFHAIAGSHFARAGRLIDGFMGSGLMAEVKGLRGFSAHAFA
jgi:hypothetical protein